MVYNPDASAVRVISYNPPAKQFENSGNIQNDLHMYLVGYLGMSGNHRFKSLYSELFDAIWFSCLSTCANERKPSKQDNYRQ